LKAIRRKLCQVSPYSIQLMQLARVCGTVVSTVKHGGFEGRKLLLIQPLDAGLKEKGKPMIAVDSIGAGAGEVVFWCRGREASFPFLPREVPTDCTIVAIVDSVFLSRG
jgi:microcompartment protein CcmK/EutM